VKLSKRAIDFQLETAKANATLPDTGRLEFRADVNIGEIIHDGDDIDTHLSVTPGSRCERQTAHTTTPIAALWQLP